MAEAWTTLYQKALRSDDAQLLQTTLRAIIAIYARLYALGFPPEPAFRHERSALFLALSDLRVLRSAFGRIKGPHKPVGFLLTAKTLALGVVKRSMAWPSPQTRSLT